MKSFNEFWKSCYVMELNPNYAQRITKFKDDFLVLENDFGFAVTGKAHDVFFI